MTTTSGALLPGAVLFGPGVPLVFGALDDVVMGGVSRTEIEPGPFSGVFRGTVSTDNNGGFAGIRTKQFTPPLDISKATGFQLKVRGDGQRYKVIARDDDLWNGIAWYAPVDTKKDKVVTVRIPVSSLTPTRFAKTVTAPPFNKKSLCGLQLTLSKFERDGLLNPSFVEGRFELVVEEITLY